MSGPISVRTSDADVRRFIPGYDRMIDEVVDVVALLGAVRIVELGAGTGALSERLLSCLPVQVTVLETDPSMLAAAGRRLAPFDAARVSLVPSGLGDPIPTADVAVAALSLRRVPAPRAKLDLYRNARASVRTLVSADTMIPRDQALAARVWETWTAHLVASGHTEEQARARFAEWATKDRYFSVEEELGMMREAGFASVDLVWRDGPVAVLVAQR